MKPKDFKLEMSWEERRPLLKERVLVVPDFYHRHKEEWSFPGWEDAALFGRSGKVFIEYCSGNGAWVIEKARAESQNLWVAVEWRFERVRKIWSKAQNLKLSNLLIVFGEAHTFTQFYLPDQCVDGIFINFPDPWPKVKHAKNRLLKQSFIQEMARIMKPSSDAVVVTDHREYADQIQAAMLELKTLKPRFSSPYFVTEWPDYGTSYFDRLWRDKGKEIRYMAYRR